MKPYILDDRNVIVAKIVPVALLALIFVTSYNLLVETKSIGVIIMLKIGLIGLTIVNSIESIEHLINHIKYKDVYLRVDEDGVFINSGNLSETVTWNQVKEIYFRRTGKTLSLLIYLTDSEEVVVFGLDPFLDGMSIYSLRRALRHFSGRHDIVKNRSLIIL